MLDVVSYRLLNEGGKSGQKGANIPVGALLIYG